MKTVFNKDDLPLVGRIAVGEEDPDTLSYGVYTCWMVLFAGK